MSKRKKKEAILLFSGGKDSFLSTCLLIEQGFKVFMVTFKNCTVGDRNAHHGAKRIIKRYGKEKVEFLGVKDISGAWRSFILPYYNLTPTEILKEFGELPISQFHCLTCRSAMYVWAIIKAGQMGISFIADGARKDQGFVIELPCMIKRFRKFFLQFSVEMLLPVWDLDDNWELENLLLRKGFSPGVLEPQCLIGAPLPDGKAPGKHIQEAVVKYFDKIVLPEAKKLIINNPNSPL